MAETRGDGTSGTTRRKGIGKRAMATAEAEPVVAEWLHVGHASS